MPFSENGSNGSPIIILAVVACMAIFCSISSGAAAYYKDELMSLFKKNDGTGDGGDGTTGDGTGDTTPIVTSNLDGAKLLTIGASSMRVMGSNCGSKTVGFGTTSTDKWVWNLKKAGDYNGNPYYTIESFYKNFASGCSTRYLTAPAGCRSPPFLAKAEFGPRQYWVITGNDTSGYQIQNLGCTKSRDAAYLMQATKDKKKRAGFSRRSGSTFTVENEYTG